MNPELKQKWVTALRSGEYKQARGKLRKVSENGISYCCLGVLAVITNLDFREYDGEIVLKGSANKFGGGSVQSLCGGYNVTEALVRLNDDQQKSFTEIADYIEETL